MIEEKASQVASSKKKGKKGCAGKKKAMLVYGIIQISATVISAVSLAAISLSLCAVKKQSDAFNNCVEEVIADGLSTPQAVRFCNGGV